MRKQYGDYYIAEILLGTSGGNMENDKIIVTEVKAPSIEIRLHGELKRQLKRIFTQAGSHMLSQWFLFQDSGPSAIGSTGMMWLTDDTDIEQLIKNFDLESLGNLVACTPDAPHATVQFEVL